MKQGFITQGFALIGVILASAALLVGSLFVVKNAFALNASVNCSTSTLNVSYNPGYNPNSLWVDWNQDGSMDITDNSVQTNNNGSRSYTIPSGVTRANVALIGSGFTTLDSSGVGWSPCSTPTPTPAPQLGAPWGQTSTANCVSGNISMTFRWNAGTNNSSWRVYVWSPQQDRWLGGNVMTQANDTWPPPWGANYQAEWFVRAYSNNNGTGSEADSGHLILNTGSCSAPTPTPTPTPPPVTITDPRLGQVTPAACESNLVPTHFQWTRATASDSSQVTEQWLDLSREPNGWDLGPGHFVNVQVSPGQSDYSAVVGNPIGPLVAEATHYWRITNYIAGRWTASAPGSFTTPPCGPTSPPPTPGGLAVTPIPPCTSINWRPTLSWSQVNGATGYKIRLRIDGDSIPAPSDIGNVTSAQIEPPGLAPNVHYLWTALAYNTVGDSPYYSPEQPIYSPTCTVPTPTPTPTPTPQTVGAPQDLRSTANCVSGNISMTFRWNAGTNNRSWRVYVWSPDQDRWLDGNLMTQTSDTWPPPWGTDYQANWFVRAYANADGTGNQADAPEALLDTGNPCGSTTPTPTPTPTLPPTPTPTPVPGIIEPVAFSATELSCNQTEGTWTMRFTWEPGRTADGDEIPQEQWLDLQFASERDWTNYVHAGPFGGLEGSYEWSGIAPNTPHRWRVGNLIRSEWYHSNEPTFTTGQCGTTATPTPIATPTPTPTPAPTCQASGAFSLNDPNGTTNQSQPTFFWNQSQGAALYYLDLSQDPNFVSFYNVPVSPNSIVNEEPFVGNIYQAWPGTPQGWPQQLPEGQTYYWRVSAWSQCALDAAQRGQDPTPYLRFGGPVSVRYEKGIQEGLVYAASQLDAKPKDEFGNVGYVNYLKKVNASFDWLRDSRNDTIFGLSQFIYLKFDDGTIPDRSSSTKIQVDPKAVAFDLTEPGMEPNKAHIWTVDTCKDSTCSTGSKLASPNSFTTIEVENPPTPTPTASPTPPVIPAKPTLKEPGYGQTIDLKGIIDNNPPADLGFAWNRADRATDYWLDVSTHTDFSSWWGCNTTDTSAGYSTCEWIPLVPDPTGSAEFGGLPAPTLRELTNGTYYWRVAAVNRSVAPPVFSVSSDTWNFTITNEPVKPTPTPTPTPTPAPVSCTPSSPFGLLNPPDVADSNSPPFDWEQKDAVSWFFDFTDQAGRDSGKWWYVKVNTNHLSQLPSMYADRYDGVQAPQVLDPNKQYYWKVTALSGCANDKFNSGDPTWVNYLTPSNGSFDAWRPVKFTQAPTPTPTPTPTIKPAAPKGLLATPGCSNDNRTQVTFTWNDAPDVDGWFVDASLDGFKTYSNAPISKSGSPSFLWDDQHIMTDRGSTFTAPNNGQTYQWRVWGYKGVVSNGTHSDDKPFVTTKNCVPRGPADLQQIALDDQACTQDNKLNVTFRWIYDKSGLIDSQWLDVSPDNSNFTPDQYFAASNPPDTATRVYTSGSGKNIPALDPGRTYYWRINAHFIGDDSNTWYTSAAPSFSTRNDCTPTGQKDFTIKVTPTNPQDATINPGQQANYAIEINYSPGWTDLLTLSPNHGQTAPGQPTIHVGYSLGGSSNVGQPTTLVGLGLQTESSTPPGTYEVPIKACKFGDPNFCHDAPTSIQVGPPPVPPEKLVAITPTPCSDIPYQVTFTWNNSGKGWWLDVSTDQNFPLDNFSNKPIDNVTSTNGPDGFNPSLFFNVGQTYYWRIYDGANETNAPKPFSVNKCPTGGGTGGVLGPPVGSMDEFKNYIKSNVPTTTVNIRSNDNNPLNPRFPNPVSLQVFMWGLAGCESGWTANASGQEGNLTFYGLYQYTIDTWTSTNKLRGVTPTPNINNGFIQIDNTLWDFGPPNYALNSLNTQWPGCTDGSGREWFNDQFLKYWP